MLILKATENHKSREILLRTGLYAIVSGLFIMDYFNALSNYGIILLTLLALGDCVKGKSRFSDIYTSPLFTPFILAFFLLLISALASKPENYPEMMHQIEKRLIFLVLPFTLIVLPSFPPKLYREVFVLFFILVTTTAIVCTIIYFTRPEEIAESYKTSKVLPTPIHHIRYSLMVCYAIFIGIFLLPRNLKPLLSLKNISLLTGVVFLIFFLHLLAVRSGLLGFYTILLLALIYFFIKKKYLSFMTLVIVILALGVFSFRHLETLQNKWAYTIYDLNQAAVNKESSNNYSISRRFLASKIAIQVFRRSPLLGMGEGNLQPEINKVYQEEYPYIEKENYLTPHNQFLRILAGTGILGFLIFFTCFYYPLFRNKNFRFFPLLCIYVLLTVSFLTEDTLQTQLGVIFGLFFILINLHSVKNKEAKSS